MRKLNVGCGSRFTSGWENIDIYSPGPEVRRVNFLRGLPYPDASFDVVYSSHVLEHFSKAQGNKLLAECLRVLKPGGLVRIVVPDISLSIEEYCRIRQMADSDPEKEPMYRWIMIELLDQLVRTRRHGEMGPFLAGLSAMTSSAEAAYVSERIGRVPGSSLGSVMPSLRTRLSGIRQKLSSRGIYYWLTFLRTLVPSSLREQYVPATAIGEKHLWMYDEYGLGSNLRAAGFIAIRQKTASSSEIPGFESDFLDTNPDGTPYKTLSLYMEACRPSGS